MDIEKLEDKLGGGKRKPELGRVPWGWKKEQKMCDFRGRSHSTFDFESNQIFHHWECRPSSSSECKTYKVVN